MTRNVQKTLGIRVALAVAVAFPLIIATSIRAQEPTAAPTGAPANVGAPTTGSNLTPAGGGAATESTAERVIVTGSNIPTAEEVGPNPVDTYRRDDITRLGVRTPTDLVNRIPSITGAEVNENFTNGGGGFTQVNLRGIDPKETLILQDGRRVVPFFGGFVDFNTFPLGLIDHMDVLKDGASPVYGTDAVAGVVNVFLIHRFRGLELYASYGNTNLGFANDSGQESAYLLAGTGDDKTNVVVYAGMFNQAAIKSADIDISHDTDWTDWNGVDNRSSNLPGIVDPSMGGSQRRYFKSVYPPTWGGAPVLLTPTPHSSANEFDNTQYTIRSAIPSERRFFNFGDYTSSVAATDREYLYGSFDRDICDKYLTVFADFKYQRTYWDGQLAASPFTPDPWVDSLHPTFISVVGISVPTQNAFNPFTVADYTSVGGYNSGIPGTEASAAAPGLEFTTGVKFRGNHDLGPRDIKNTYQNYLFTGGLKGNLGEFANAWDKLKTWEWEAGVRWNEIDEISNQGKAINNYNLRIALLDTDPATAFNPFGIGKNTKAAQDFVYTRLLDDTVGSLLTEDFTLRGDMFDLPGGPVSFAIGAAHETDHLADQPDTLLTQNQSLAFVAFQPTHGSRDIWSVFWEGRVPITGPTWNFPGAYSLEFDYAERFEEYSDFHVPVERPKFSVRWQPIDQALTLRAAYMEAFHAPGVNELYGGAAQSFTPINDPESLDAGENQPEVFFRSNPDLTPEFAYEYTYGGVMTPGKWWAPLQGLTLSADFLHIDLRDYAAAIDPQVIVDLAAEGSLPTYYGTPGPVNGLWVQRASAGPCSSTDNAPPGPSPCLIEQVNDPLVNLGRFTISTWDFEEVYIFDTSRLGHGDFGTFTETVNWTYLVDADIQVVKNGKRNNVAGQFGSGFQGAGGNASFPRNRAYMSLFYDGPSGSWMQGIDAGVTVHYIGQYWDLRGTNGGSQYSIDNRKIREWTTLDLIINYTFNMPPPAAQTEVAGYAKDGGKNVKMKDGKEKNVMPVSTAEYNPCGWRAWLNNMTLTFGMQNVMDDEPPFVSGNFLSDNQGYDQGQANAKGRTWYVAVKKRF